MQYRLTSHEPQFPLNTSAVGSIILNLAVMLLFAADFLGARNFVVVNNNDAGIGSFRAAIDSANYCPGHDTISFNIPGGYRDHIISILSQLPSLDDTCGLLIDGYTQPGSYLGNPPEDMLHMIVVDGHLAGDLHGIVIKSSNNTVQGLTIVNFKQDGIRIEAVSRGSCDNLIYANSIGIYDCVHAMGNGTNHNENWAGVHIIGPSGDSGFARHNVIEGNVISANYADGVRITGGTFFDVCSTRIKKDYIGTCQFGTSDKGNIQNGVYIGEGAYHNKIIVCTISGNGLDGVAVLGNATEQLWSNDNSIDSCKIGGSGMPNDLNGISIGLNGPDIYEGFAFGNSVSNSDVAYNGQSGIAIWEHSSNATNADKNSIINTVLGNNGSLGIDLGADGVTYNDPGDLDDGPNQEINFPVITAADAYEYIVPVWWHFIVTGTVDIDTDPTQAIVEIYGAANDPTGYGEGDFLMFTATPDPNGNWYVNEYFVTYSPDYITATVTDSSGNTSEFSLCHGVWYHLGVEENNIDDRFSDYKLEQNKPNPFTRFTEIGYYVSEITHINLTIYDVSGSLVKTLFDGQCVPSQRKLVWDGCDDSGRRAASGVYIYRLKTDLCEMFKKMILMR